MDGTEFLRSVARRWVATLVCARGLVAGLFLGLALVVFVGLVPQSALAGDKITFPDEDLASESVLPVVENPVSVKNKSLRMPGRFEIGLAGDLSLLEPFYNPIGGGLHVGYHFSDAHAFNITGIMFAQGLSNNANNLNPVPGSNPTYYMNLQYAPEPKYLVLGDYQYTGFYGKMSLTKEFVMHLHLYGILGLGAYGIGDAVEPAFDIGIGQKLYFTNNFGIRLDFRFITFQGPDVLSRDLSKVSTVQPASSFSTTTQFLSMLSFGIVYMFPGM